MSNRRSIPAAVTHRWRYTPLASPSGDLVFVSGQGPVDFGSMEFRLGTIEHETEMTILNVQAVLSEAGCTFADVAKATVHLADIADL